MAITICVGNYKGGVGKTKNAILSAYHMAKKGHKTLVIDLDPQGNATTVLLRTKKLYTDEIFSFNKTLMAGIKEGNIKGIETEIFDNFYLLPSYIDFANYPGYLISTYGIAESGDRGYSDVIKNQIMHLDKLLVDFKKEFDYIIIDVPPTKSLITDSAVATSNYIWIILQTQELSLDGATTYVKDLKKLMQSYDLSFEVCGILPVLMDNNVTLDKFILENARETFGETNIFDNIVPNMARLKRFDNTGITEFDRHDEKVMKLYSKIADELIERIDYFEKGEEDNE